MNFWVNIHCNLSDPLYIHFSLKSLAGISVGLWMINHELINPVVNQTYFGLAFTWLTFPAWPSCPALANQSCCQCLQSSFSLKPACLAIPPSSKVSTTVSTRLLYAAVFQIGSVVFSIVEDTRAVACENQCHWVISLLLQSNSPTAYGARDPEEFWIWAPSLLLRRIKTSFGKSCHRW